VQLRHKTNRKRGIGKILLVGLMLFLWVGTAALAASPQLHHRLHKDSRDVTHECLVTLLSKSQLLAGGPESFILVLMPVFFGLLLAEECFQLPAIRYRLSPSRAPPLPCSSKLVAG